MKCPKCGYVTHDYLDACSKCHNDWVDLKRAMHLQVLQPGELDLSVVIGTDMGSFGGTSSFNVDDSFFNTQTLIVDREKVALEEDDEAFDVEIDDDAPREPTAEVPVTPWSESTRQTGEDLMDEPPEEADLIQLAGDAAEEEFIDLGLNEAPVTGIHTAAFDPSALEHVSHPPVDMIDMSDLEELGDENLKAFEDVGIELDASDMASVAPAESVPASTPEEREGRALPVFDLSDFDKTLELSLPEVQERPPVPAPPDVVPEPTSDERLEAELAFELEDMESTPLPPPPSPLPTLEIDAELELELDNVELAPPPDTTPPAQTTPQVDLDVEALELEEDDERP